MRIQEHLYRFMLHFCLVSGVVPFLLFSCICDHTADCEFEVSFYVAVGEREPGGVSEPFSVGQENATAYVFNSGGLLKNVFKIDVEAILEARPINFKYQGADLPTVVVWTNFSGTEEHSSSATGSLRADSWIRWGEAEGYALSPGALFNGQKKLKCFLGERLVVTPHIGQLSVTARTATDVQDRLDDFYFTIETAYSGFDFYALPLQRQATAKSLCALNANRNELVTPEPLYLTLYPDNYTADQVIKVSLYQMDDQTPVLLAKVTTDITGNNIIPVAGRNTNVLIDLTDANDIRVVIRITDWDIIEQWSEW